MKEYKINKYLKLKLEPVFPEEGLLGNLIGMVTKKFLNMENLSTFIYVNEERFNQCKYLLLEIPKDKVEEFDDVDSIDEASERLDNSLEVELRDPRITAETEFWAHCSNMQAWVENNYDTRLLHRNLAFPLLKKLTEAGDIKASRAFKEEIAKRFSSGHLSVIEFLIEENYLDYFEHEEIDVIIEDLKRLSLEFAVVHENKIRLLKDNRFNLSALSIEKISEILFIGLKENIKELNLSHNKIKKIEGLERFINLEVLNLSYNEIKRIENLNNENLIKINLNGNYIREIKGLENLRRLKKFSLWLNPLKLSEMWRLFLPITDIIDYSRTKNK